MHGIYVIDSQPCYVRGLELAISSEPDLFIVGSSGTVIEGVAGLAASGASLAIVDVSLRDFDPAVLRAVLRDTPPRVRAMALTQECGLGLVGMARTAGMAGYLLKQAKACEIMDAVRNIVAGGTSVDPMVSRWFEACADDFDLALLAETSVVTAREMDVIKRVARGHSCKDIGQTLGISPKSAETYKARALLKLGLSSRVDLVRFASVCGWFCSPY